jgi:hypothetical protein
MVAVPLIFGRLTAADYEDAVANDPRIDALRDKIVCVEDKQFTKDYHDPEKRSIANALTVEFNDGKKPRKIAVEYPIGHKRRRKEGMPVLVEPSSRPTSRVVPHQAAGRDPRPVPWTQKQLAATPVNEFVDLFVDLDESTKRAAMRAQHRFGTLQDLFKSLKEFASEEDRQVLLAARAREGDRRQGLAPAGVDPHRARVRAAQLRRQEGDRSARAAARELEAERRPRRRDPVRRRAHRAAGLHRRAAARRPRRHAQRGRARWARTRR